MNIFQGVLGDKDFRQEGKNGFRELNLAAASDCRSRKCSGFDRI